MKCDNCFYFELSESCGNGYCRRYPSAILVSSSDWCGEYKSREKKTVSRFVKPTEQEVREYCKERGNNIDPKSFVAFYESKGWKIGNTPMKSWKAAITTWENREKPSQILNTAPVCDSCGNPMELVPHLGKYRCRLCE